jgi:hypothetical protein
MKLLPVSRENIFKGTMYAILLCATGHLLGTLYMAIVHNDPDIVNMFNVIGLSLFFPQLAHGALNCLLGILFVIAVGTWFALMQQWHDQKRAAARKKS